MTQVASDRGCAEVCEVPEGRNGAAGERLGRNVIDVGGWECGLNVGLVPGGNAVLGSEDG